MDFSSVVFPLEGETFCTGNEFYLAMQLKCQIEILGGVYIPFKTHEDSKEDEALGSGEFKEIKEIKEIFVRDPFFNRLDSGMQSLLMNAFPELKTQKQQQETYSPCSDNHCSFVENLDNTEANRMSNFFLVVKELLIERLKYPKGSYMNLLYKFLANAGIGQMARGLNRKPKYDSKTNSTKVLPSGELASPLYAG